MKDLQPINQNVLIEIKQEKEQKTSTGIYLPDTASEKENTGKIVSISNIDNPEIAIGNIVLYKEHSGTEIEFEKKKYLLIQYADILAKIVETDEI